MDFSAITRDIETLKDKLEQLEAMLRRVKGQPIIQGYAGKALDLNDNLNVVLLNKRITTDEALIATKQDQLTNTDAEIVATVTLAHGRSHAITSSEDHTSSATPGAILKADANGFPVDATAANVESSHTHSKIVASDGSPDPALSADASGNCTCVAKLRGATGQFGGDTHYSEFETDGTYKANGNATTFDDLLGDVTRIQVSGVGIVADNTENALKFQASANLSDYAVSNYQLRHRWKAGSSVFPHIHFEQTENAVPNFLIRYRWQLNGGAKTTAWTDYKCNTLAFTYVSGTLNNIAYGAAVLAPSGYSISDILQLRIFRDSANTSIVFTGLDPFTTDALVTGIDIHIEEDTLGSRSEYAK